MNSIELWRDFAINFIAGVTGILLVLMIERQRRPKLSLSVGTPNQISGNDLMGRPSATWLYVSVRNERAARWLRWVYSKEPALACRATIFFYAYPNLEPLNMRPMIGRWAETPEPVVEVIELPRLTPSTETQLVHVNKTKVLRMYEVQQTFDIPSDVSTNLDVVFRLQGDVNCYGWCNESYVHDWKHPDYRLSKGCYVAKVVVKTSGVEYKGAFLIVNDRTYEDFRLELLDRKTLNKLG